MQPPNDQATSLQGCLLLFRSNKEKEHSPFLSEREKEFPLPGKEKENTLQTLFFVLQ